MVNPKNIVLKYLNRFLIKYNKNLISAEEKNIQLLESKIGEIRLKFLLGSLGIKTVIDIGASYGDFIHLAQSSNSSIKIYGFEPISNVFDSLKYRYAGKNEIELYNMALGSFDGYVDFHENDYSYSSSVLPIGEIHINEFPFTKDFKKSEVEIACLDTVFKYKSFETPLLIKIDVQGYEDKVILGGKNIFSQADFVIVELSFCELYSGQALFERVNMELNNLGLFYKGCISQLSSPTTNTILQQDALYVRKK